VELFVFGDVQYAFTQLNPEDVPLDQLYGGATSGSDILTGSNFGERIDGGAGDDELIGGDGGDTYIFDVGYGHDVIVDRRTRASNETFQQMQEEYQGKVWNQPIPVDTRLSNADQLVAAHPGVLPGRAMSAYRHALDWILAAEGQVLEPAPGEAAIDAAADVEETA